MTEEFGQEVESDPATENARLRQQVHFLEAEMAISGRAGGARGGRMPRPSTDSAVSMTESSKYKPKPEKPVSFDGSYTPKKRAKNGAMASVGWRLPWQPPHPSSSLPHQLSTHTPRDHHRASHLHILIGSIPTLEFHAQSHARPLLS